MLTKEDVERLRRSLAMATSLPASEALRLLDAIAELLRERGRCCRAEAEGPGR